MFYKYISGLCYRLSFRRFLRDIRAKCRERRELDLTLTGRDCGLETRVPMVGFPYHVADNYISKLVSKGYKVAVAVTMDNIVLKQNDMAVDTATDEILNAEKQEKTLMKNYHKDALASLLELFGDDAIIG